MHPSNQIPDAPHDEPQLLIDPHRRVASMDGSPIDLGGRAFDLLLQFARRPGQLLSLDDLVTTVWGRRVVEPGNLRVQINQLRRRLRPGVIRNVPGRGYRFEGQARIVGGTPADPTDAALIGREADLAELDDLLASRRLVTVAGSGGIGKTSLVRAWFRQVGSACRCDPRLGRPCRPGRCRFALARPDSRPRSARQPAGSD